MFRSCLLVFGFALGAMLANSGCQSCSSCHDYDCPVANCDCAHCPHCGPNAACATSGCGCCSGGGCDSGSYGPTGPVMYDQPVEGEIVVPNGNRQPSTTN